MQNGWRGLFAVEKNSMAFETLSFNLVNNREGLKFSWPSWFPKKNISVSAFLNKYKGNIAKLKGRVTLIAGGPPCQGFSLAGKRDKHDPRNILFREYIKVVRAIKPKLLLMENVGGITVSFNAKNENCKLGRPAKSYSERIRAMLETDYYVYADVVRACDFGVPQLRPRFILVGIRKDLINDKKDVDPLKKLIDIKKIFLTSKNLSTKKSLSVKEAISDLETEGNNLIDCEDSEGFKQVQYIGPLTDYQSLMHGVTNGKSPNSMRLARHRPPTIKRFKKMHKIFRKGVALSPKDKARIGLKKHMLVILDENKPSHTLTTSPDDLLHYSEPRILTVREHARIQSFPDWYEFKSNYTSGGKRRAKECPRYTQVGNAVPPLLAEALGLTLSTILKN